MTRPSRSCRALLLALVLGALPLWAARAQTLETETARLLARKAAKFGANFEYQRSTEGREKAVPMFFEYGVTSTTELVIEPVDPARVAIAGFSVTFVEFQGGPSGAPRHRAGHGDLAPPVVPLVG